MAMTVFTIVTTLVLFFLVRENYGKWTSDMVKGLKNNQETIPDGSADSVSNGDVLDQAVSERIIYGRSTYNPLPLHRLLRR